MHAVKFICFILVPAAWPSVIQLFIGIVVPSGAHIIKKKNLTAECLFFIHGSVFIHVYSLLYIFVGKILLFDYCCHTFKKNTELSISLLSKIDFCVESVCFCCVIV